MATVSPAKPWAYTLQLPHDPGSARIARAIVRALLDHYNLDELTATATLLTSELVTNAYLHSNGPASLRVRGLSPDRLRISVCDTNPVIPAPFDRPPVDLLGPCGTSLALDAESGRGLLLVRLCAANWGGYALGEELFGMAGKLLWFELLPEREAFGVAA
ncbi:ATP-binding protein [Streptomyces sp. NPDC003077]|uniref:ATP-binding protein n=1 Tax=Streptomyces sp. NPDC003077 TaxID=3154443 RepID=UPI0033A52BF5